MVAVKLWGQSNFVYKITLTSEVTANDLLQIDIQSSQYMNFFGYLCLYAVPATHIHT